MQKIIAFPEEESAGILFAAEKAYSLDDCSIEWLGEAMGSIALPDEGYSGLIFNRNLDLRRRLLRNLDLSCLQILYFHNPFELNFDDLANDFFLSEGFGGEFEPDDEDCALLASLYGLRAINLTESRITDQGVKALSELQSLESLSLVNTAISDFAIECLSGLIDLRELDLSFTFITDEGVSRLAAVKTLEDLRLAATAVTDEGIKNLASLSRLSFLDLSETVVSEEGIDMLRRALPDCLISFDTQS